LKKHKFLSYSNILFISAKEFPKNFKKIPKKILKKFPKKFPKKSQDFEKIQFPTSGTTTVEDGQKIIKTFWVNTK
jgi:hypothetical protein